MSSRYPEERESGAGMGNRERRWRWPVLSRVGELAVLAVPALALLVAGGVQHRTELAALVVPVATAQAAQPIPDSRARFPVLRVCSDPNNLPFSNAKGEGFENKLAELVAHELGAELRYTWRAQRRGFVRETLRANQCDLIMGVPSSFELVLPTRPY